MSLGANINVWTLGRGANGRWTLHHTTDDLQDAIDWFAKLDAEGKRVALYELGLFLHEGMETAGQVAFWWNEPFNDYMEGEPEDRGTGWSDDFGTWVAYEYPQPVQTQAAAALPAIRPEPLPVAAAPPPERYVEASCERCGLILPMNQLQYYTHEVRTGRTSGTSRSSRSTSSRSSKNSFSSGSSFGSSSTSGRSFYKTETLLLCDSCLAQQKAASSDLLSRFIRYMTRLD